MTTRIDNPDGSYSVVTFLNSRGEVVEKEEAVEAVIVDFDASGEMVSEAWGSVGSKRNPSALRNTKMELLAVPAALAGIHGLRLCPAGCLGGVRPEAFEPVEGSDVVERVLGPECPTCGGTGIDPSCYEGCCDEGERGAVITLGFGDDED
jgi:hypothetical protein